MSCYFYFLKRFNLSKILQLSRFIYFSLLFFCHLSSLCIIKMISNPQIQLSWSISKAATGNAFQYSGAYAADVCRCTSRKTFFFSWVCASVSHSAALLPYRCVLLVKLPSTIKYQVDSIVVLFDMLATYHVCLFIFKLIKIKMKHSFSKSHDTFLLNSHMWLGPPCWTVQIQNIFITAESSVGQCWSRGPTSNAWKWQKGHFLCHLKKEALKVF